MVLREHSLHPIAKITCFASACALLAVSACGGDDFSSNDVGTTGTGAATTTGGTSSGGTATGGAAHTGGSSGSGGAAGSGGIASGGTTGSGGIMASGGMAGSGGATSTGGMADTGGVSSSGGMSGSGGTNGSGGASSGGVSGTGGVIGSGGTPNIEGGTALCSGQPCGPDEFCCGPPDCGHCVNVNQGPVCPTLCTSCDQVTCAAGFTCVCGSIGPAATCACYPQCQTDAECQLSDPTLICCGGGCTDACTCTCQ